MRAVDRSGNLSAPAAALAIERPENTGKGESTNAFVDFKAAKSLLDSNPPSAPENLSGKIAPDGALHLEWNPVSAGNLAGYVVFMSDYPPDKHAGHFMQLATTAASVEQRIKAGDMVIVSKKFYKTSRNQQISNRVWNAWGEYSILLPGLVDFFPDESEGKRWELVRHDPSTPVEDAGETYLKLEVGAGAKESIGMHNHSGTAQTYYQVLEKRAYKVEVWLRRESGSGSVRFRVDPFYVRQIEPIVFEPGNKWQKFVATFTPEEINTTGQANRMHLEFSGPGIFSVDNFRVYQADTEYLDYTARQYGELKASGMQALRTHGFIKTGFRTYDLAQITKGGGITSVRGRGNTIPQTLKLIRKAGVRPWLQLEFHMSPQEWLGFVEFMAAPFDPKTDTPGSKPWAHKRYRQGQAAPWSDVFDQIYFELGNETWNRLFYPWIFDGMADAATGKTYTGGQVYGQYQEYIISILRSSPYWRQANLDKKFKFVLGGWAGLPYGREAALVSPSSQHMTVAGYNGGWDEGEGPPALNSASLFNVLTQVSQSAIPQAEMHAKELAEIIAKRATPLRTGTYEAGPGYALNGLNNVRVTAEQARQQEQVMKSLAAGTATLDSFLARAYRGFDLQNFFVFKDGEYWSSHALWHRGGQAYPSWKLLALFNNEATGDMLRTETISAPSTDLQAYQRCQGVKNAPLAAVYATQKGKRVSVAVVSRKVPGYPRSGDDGFTSVTVDLPFKSAKSITLFRMQGDPKDNNLMADNVKIEKAEIAATSFKGRLSLNAAVGADARGLAPAATFLYVFNDVIY